MEFALIQHFGVTYWAAWTIVKAIEAGMSIASIIALVSGVGAWIGVFYSVIKKKIWDLGTTAVVFW